MTRISPQVQTHPGLTTTYELRVFVLLFDGQGGIGKIIILPFVLFFISI